MSKKEDEAYQAWLSDVKSKLSDPEDVKAFERLSSKEEAAKEVFRGGLREGDYYRRLNELHEQRSEFEKKAAGFESDKQTWTTWYEENAPVVTKLQKERQELAARLAGAQAQLRQLGLEDEANKLDPTRGVVNQPNDSEIEELKKKLVQFDKALPALLSQYGNVMTRIVKEGYDVAPEAIIDYSTRYRVDLNQAFNALTKDQQAEREKTRLEEMVKKAKEEGRREAMAGIPAPDRARPAGPTILDSIRDKTTNLTDKRSRISGAVEEFLEMDRAGAGV